MKIQYLQEIVSTTGLLANIDQHDDEALANIRKRLDTLQLDAE